MKQKKKQPNDGREREIELEAGEQLQCGWPCEAEERIAHAGGGDEGGKNATSWAARKTQGAISKDPFH